MSQNSPQPATRNGDSSIPGGSVRVWAHVEPHESPLLLPGRQPDAPVDDASTLTASDGDDIPALLADVRERFDAGRGLTFADAEPCIDPLLRPDCDMRAWLREVANACPTPDTRASTRWAARAAVTGQWLLCTVLDHPERRRALGRTLQSTTLDTVERFVTPASDASIDRLYRQVLDAGRSLETDASDARASVLAMPLSPRALYQHLCDVGTDDLVLRRARAHIRDLAPSVANQSVPVGGATILPPTDASATHARRLVETLDTHVRTVRAFAGWEARLVVSLVNRAARRGLLTRSFMQTVQHGLTGLVEAAARFEAHHGYRFTTWAQWWVWAAMDVEGPLFGPGDPRRSRGPVPTDTLPMGRPTDDGPT